MNIILKVVGKLMKRFLQVLKALLIRFFVKIVSKKPLELLVLLPID